MARPKNGAPLGVRKRLLGPRTTTTKSPNPENSSVRSASARSVASTPHLLGSLWDETQAVFVLRSLLKHATPLVPPASQ